MKDWTEEQFEDYCRETSQAYWAEEEELKAGIHSTQVRERIEKALGKLGHTYEEVSFLDWNIDGPRVIVHTNGSYFGVFDYEDNEFESTPSSRLETTIRLNDLGPRYDEVCH